MEIFFIDDDIENHFLLQEFFKGVDDISLIMSFFADGRQALDYLENLPGSASLPSLIVTDVKMPAFDGLETLYALKKSSRLQAIKVVMLTDSTLEQDDCLKLGADGYFLKPYTFADGVDIARKLYAIANA